MPSRSPATTSPTTTSLPRSRVARAAPSTRRPRSASARPRRQRLGSRKSRRTALAKIMIHVVGLLLAVVAALPFGSIAEGLQSYAVAGDGIPDSLTGSPGDAARGRALVLDRASTCILCHSGPFPETRFQGDLAPSLAGAGSRWSSSQLRLRLVDASRFNPATIMPSYYRVDGLSRVGPAWRGKPVLSAEQIEDIVAYLATLRD